MGSRWRERASLERIWVAKLSGPGATLNFAHVRSWVILIAILAVPIGGVILALVAALGR
jgi:uncharacterized membrane protein